MNHWYVVITPFGDPMTNSHGQILWFDSHSKAADHAVYAHGNHWHNLFLQGFKVQIMDRPFIHAGERI